MTINKEKLKLYLVTDNTWLNGDSIESVVEKAILGGVTIVQLREKNATYEDFKAKAISLKKITDKYNIPLIINDDINLAMEIGASGVHIGQSDTELLDARIKMGDKYIIGVSTRTVEQANLAEKNGASYIGIGAVFGTTTKGDAKTINPDVLKEVASSVSIPSVAIGGVSLSNIDQLKDSNVSGVAVVSAVLKPSDKTLASKQLLSKVNEILYN